MVASTSSVLAVDVEHAHGVDLDVEEASRASGSSMRSEPSTIDLRRPLVASNSTITPTREPGEVLVLQRDPPELHREPEDVDARLAGNSAARSPSSTGAFRHRVLGEQDVADRARGQPLAQRVGVGAPVDADDAAGADPEDAVGEVHAGAERRADDEHERPVALEVGRRSGQLVEAEGGDASSGTAPSAGPTVSVSTPP